jgi:hypothetical protein
MSFRSIKADEIDGNLIMRIFETKENPVKILIKGWLCQVQKVLC